MMKPAVVLILIIELIAGGVTPCLRNAFGQSQLVLPPSGVPVSLSPVVHPPVFKGVRVSASKPLEMAFVLDVGDSRADTQQLRVEAETLSKYFLAALTLPEKDLWVNLSPYEKDRVVPEALGRTVMGRDMLAEDYLLKQIAASLLYPEGETGKKFWAEIYRRAREEYGTTDIPVDTFNKVWIVPQRAVVYEQAKTDAKGEVQGAVAYISDSRLKVMLDTDYLALTNNGHAVPDSKEQALGREVLRSIVIPVLEKEVNEGERFSRLRQVYASFILAAWYKKKLHHGLLAQVYVDRNKVQGVHIDDPKMSDGIWRQYVDLFKNGVFDIIREDRGTATEQDVPRKYFSGGCVLTSRVLTLSAEPPVAAPNGAQVVLMDMAARPDPAATTVAGTDSPEVVSGDLLRDGFVPLNLDGGQYLFVMTDGRDKRDRSVVNITVFDILAPGKPRVGHVNLVEDRESPGTWDLKNAVAITRLDPRSGQVIARVGQQYGIPASDLYFRNDESAGFGLWVEMLWRNKMAKGRPGLGKVLMTIGSMAARARGGVRLLVAADSKNNMQTYYQEQFGATDSLLAPEERWPGVMTAVDLKAPVFKGVTFEQNSSGDIVLARFSADASSTSNASGRLDVDALVRTGGAFVRLDGKEFLFVLRQGRWIDPVTRASREAIWISAIDRSAPLKRLSGYLNMWVQPGPESVGILNGALAPFMIEAKSVEDLQRYDIRDFQLRQRPDAVLFGLWVDREWRDGGGNGRPHLGRALMAAGALVAERVKNVRRLLVVSALSSRVQHFYQQYFAASPSVLLAEEIEAGFPFGIDLKQLNAWEGISFERNAEGEVAAFTLEERGSTSGADHAGSPEEKRGGIDLASAMEKVEVKGAGSDFGAGMDLKALERYRSAAGFDPVIVSVRPLSALSDFIGDQMLTGR